jgi:cytochrome c-type biogenesis protein CcmH/NrfF
MRTVIALAFCLVCGVGVFSLQASNLVPPPMAPAQAKIYACVTSRVLAPCCWSQPVQTHQSEAAETVRAEVVAYIRQGYSEKQIFTRLAAEYGERILGEPRGVRGAIAFVTPFIMLARGLACVIYVLFRLAMRQPQLPTNTGLLPDLPEIDL